MKRTRAAGTTGASLAVTLCLSAALSSACATERHAAKPSDALAARFALADAQRARDLAPDLYARSERAREDARHSDDAAARADHELRAQLLLDAAAAEADRVSAQRATWAADARTERAQEQRAELERRRLALESEAARAQAARQVPARAADATFLCDRARFTLAAALALGLDPERGDALERAIARAQNAATSKARMTAAKQALAEAERALGAARSARATE